MSVNFFPSLQNPPPPTPPLSETQIQIYFRLVGNSILRNTDPHYTNNASAAFIGVVGSLILSPPLYLSYLLIPTSPGVPRHNNLKKSSVIVFLAVFGFPLFSTVTGLIGSTVLLHCHIDLGGIDISHASLAGLYGGGFLSLPAVIGFRFMPLVVSVIISSSWLVIMRGVQLVHATWTEIGMDKSHSDASSSRVDDPEIQVKAESQSPPSRV